MRPLAFPTRGRRWPLAIAFLVMVSCVSLVDLVRNTFEIRFSIYDGTASVQRSVENNEFVVREGKGTTIEHTYRSVTVPTRILVDHEDLIAISASEVVESNTPRVNVVVSDPNKNAAVKPTRTATQVPTRLNKMRMRIQKRSGRTSPALSVPAGVVSSRDPGVQVAPPQGALFNGTHMLVEPQVRFVVNDGGMFRFDVLVAPGLLHNISAWPESIRMMAEVFIRKDGWEYNQTNPHWFITKSGQFPLKPINGSRQLINSIGKSSCVAGNKHQQLQCRFDFTEMHGCDFHSLEISPRQFSLQDASHCRDFFKKANNDRMYILKSATGSHGVGIEIFHGTKELRNRFGDCNSTNNFVVMDYIDHPALLDGRKVDFRTFFLVASMRPKLVFYHDGYARIAAVPYHRNAKDERAHISNARNQSGKYMNMTYLASRLEAEHPDIFQADRFLHGFRKRAKSITTFVFEVGMVDFHSPSGRYQIFAVDWSLDSNGKMSLLEVNSSPGFPTLGSYLGPVDTLLESTVELVELIQTDAVHSISSDRLLVKAGYKYKGFELVYNEMEAWYDRVHDKPYDPCKAFSRDFDNSH